MSSSEVEARRGRYGPNHIVEVAGHPFGELARDTARDPMIWFLLATAVLYAFLRQFTESLTLFVSIVPLVGMDAYLHRRTQASTRGLRSALADTARVVRDGRHLDIAATELVVGDLALIRAGEPFPVDGIIVASDGAQVEESALTGESYPVRKHTLEAEPVGLTPRPIDDVHWAMAGTRLLTGEVSVRVAFTGGETLYGEIVRMATLGGGERTPLQQAVARLVSGLIIAAGALCLVLGAVRLAQGQGWIDAALSAATLAVAALPEEFPVVLSVFLGVGVYRLARRQALVRRAVAVENIGRVSCICADKTGTLTEGRLRVVGIEPAPGTSELAALGVAAQASRQESGDPLDLAILDAVRERGAPSSPGEVLATFPFSEDRRHETVIVRAAGTVHAASKGAPETILAMAALDAGELAAWRGRAEALAALGHKVIACATCEMDPAGPHGDEPRAGYRLAGLLAISDPLRPEVASSVAWCQAAGIRVLVVTGDHPATARAIARQMGLADEPAIVTGDQLADQADAAGLAAVDVVARALPIQKLAIVRALKAAGELVAVTGDGVNDVPALRAADVGIAMGGRGTRSAREVSPIVLLDDDFSSIVAAIREGRSLYRNLTLSFQYLLIVHIPLVLTAALIPLFGFPLLYLPVHLVWLEAIIHPTALLVFQERGEAPPPWRGSARRATFLSPRQWLLTLATGALMTIAIAVAYVRSLGPAGDAEHARAMAMVVLTVAGAGVTALLSRMRTRAAWIALAATLASTVLLVQAPAVAKLLHLRPLHLDDGALALAGAALAVLPLLLRGGTGRRRSDIKG